MKLFFAVVVLLMVALVQPDQAAAPCKIVVQHPMPTVTKDAETSTEVSEFVQSIEWKCPEGTHIYDPKGTVHADMSYKDIVNAIARVECR